MVAVSDVRAGKRRGHASSYLARELLGDSGNSSGLAIEKGHADAGRGSNVDDAVEAQRHGGQGEERHDLFLRGHNRRHRSVSASVACEAPRDILHTEGYDFSGYHGSVSRKHRCTERNFLEKPIATSRACVDCVWACDGGKDCLFKNLNPGHDGMDCRLWVVCSRL